MCPYIGGGGGGSKVSDGYGMDRLTHLKLLERDNET
jgi:hypothetical protein